MILADIIPQYNGIKHITELLPLRSSAGRKRMLSQTFMTKAKDIKEELDKVEEMYGFLLNPQFEKPITAIQQTLMQIHYIQNSLNALVQKHIMDEIELFEIKRFALLCEEITTQLDTLSCQYIAVPDLNKVIELLDPESNRTAHFFIYSAYDPLLAEARRQYKALEDEQSDEAQLLREQCLNLEDRIRQRLSKNLHSYSSDLMQAWEAVATLDFTLARAGLALESGLVRPQIASDITQYEGLFHPGIKEILQKKNQRFHPWDIQLFDAPCLITGANMAGKTVLLKTIALNQYLLQFGFFVAAAKADIVPVDVIRTAFDDEQSELTGLSSFAAEIVRLQSVLSAIKEGKKMLVLIDEPARTTNPHEGLAIANALIDLLEKHRVRSLITTHYSKIQSSCRKLRIKGLKIPETISAITIDTINRYMDYSLMEHRSNEAPREAIQIARLLGLDEELISLARFYAGRNETEIEPST
ncbi:MAG: DNA mismatch repair protein MutS [Bacteroidales bacterium]|nr:DNA mismatch repair protein MutS [Bacteroidales bacterium]